MKRGLHGAVAMLLVMLLLITSMPMAALAEIVKVDTSSGIQPFSILPEDTKVLTYEFYVGEKLVDTQRVGDGETLVAPETPTQDGHKFMGWTEDPKVPNPTYQSFGTPINVTGTKTIELYAHFEEVYYVFFMDDGGRVYETRWGTSGQKIEADVTFPVGSDEAITGWYDNPDCKGEKVESVVLDHSNVTLYPNVERGAWLTFDSAGGTYIEPVFVAPGQTTSQPEVPTRAGYNFAGWYQGETEFEFGSGIEGNTTLTARWTARNDTPYTVIYWIENADDDGYTFERVEQSYGITGQEIILDHSQTSERNINSDYRDYFHYDHCDPNVMISGDGSSIVNVYFKRNIYDIKIEFARESVDWWGRKTYSIATGNRRTDITQLPTVEINGNQYHTTYTFSAKYEQDISSLWPTVQNVTVSPRGNGDTYNLIYLYGGAENIANASKRLVLTADLISDKENGSTSEFTAYWSRNTQNYKLNYYLQPVNGSTDHKDYVLSEKYSQEIEYSNTDRWSSKDLEGFTKEKEYAEKSGNNFNMYYFRNKYTITFHNGSEITTTEPIYFEADISSYDWTPGSDAGSEYEFDGWYTTEECTEGTKFEFKEQTMPAHNVVLYARWIPREYTVTVYDSMGDTAEEIARYSVPAGDKLDEGSFETYKQKVKFNPETDTWHGWAIRTVDGNNVTYTPFNFDTEIHQDTVLYPYYTSNASFTVSYDLNGGTGTKPSDEKKYAQYSYADVMPAKDVVAPNGQVFLHWNTSADGNGTSVYPGDRIQITDNVTLYAIYGPTPEGTQITYVLNYPGAETQPKSISLINNAAHTVLNWNDSELSFGVTVDGYEFVGWSTKEQNPADDIEADYEAGTEIIVNKSNDDSENILYGCWKPKKGTLVIEKILPEAGGGGKQFTFEVRKQGSDKVFDTVTVIVDDKTGSQTITLPEGMYTVREVLDKNQDYIVSPEQEQTAKIEKNKTTWVKFTNTLPKYDVTIKKKVTGNMYNTNDEFAFEAIVTFNGNSYKISDGDGYSVDPDTNKITFTLKGNESVVLKGVPKYATVTVTETDRKDYTTSYQAGNAEKTDGETAEITVWGESSVTFINDKTITIDTGVNLDVLPYLLMLAVAGGAVALLLVLKRRKTQE